MLFLKYWETGENCLRALKREKVRFLHNGNENVWLHEWKIAKESHKRIQANLRKGRKRSLKFLYFSWRTKRGS